MVNLQANLKETLEPGVEDYFELLKPKVMRLVVFTAAIGLVAAPQTVHPVVAVASLLCVAVGAGAAGALNMWWDADIDRLMKRTKERPIPSGRISAEQTLSFGIILSILSVMMLGLFANAFAAGLLAFTIFFYLVVYSMWLKKLTPQNIVIGGAAGAFPPMIGWSIASGGIGLESIMMFSLIFIWTPPHFWTLALFVNQDYSKARIPMLTVTHGTAYTRKHIVIYTCALLILSILITFSTLGGPLYALVCIPLNLWFLWGAIKISMRDELESKLDSFKVEKELFVFSIGYLFANFGIIGIETFLKRIIPNYLYWPQIF